MRPHSGDEERLVYAVIAAFYEVYNRLEFGFFESVYANALELELRSRGHAVEREVAVCVSYKWHPVGRQRLDMGLLLHFGPKARFYRLRCSHQDAAAP